MKNLVLLLITFYAVQSFAEPEPYILHWKTTFKTSDHVQLFLDKPIYLSKCSTHAELIIDNDFDIYYEKGVIPFVKILIRKSQNCPSIIFGMKSAKGEFTSSSHTQRLRDMPAKRGHRTNWGNAEVFTLPIVSPELLEKVDVKFTDKDEKKVYYQLNFIIYGDDAIEYNAVSAYIPADDLQFPMIPMSDYNIFNGPVRAIELGDRGIQGKVCNTELSFLLERDKETNQPLNLALNLAKTSGSGSKCGAYKTGLYHVSQANDFVVSPHTKHIGKVDYGTKSYMRIPIQSPQELIEYKGNLYFNIVIFNRENSDFEKIEVKFPKDKLVIDGHKVTGAKALSKFGVGTIDNFKLSKESSKVNWIDISQCRKDQLTAGAALHNLSLKNEQTGSFETFSALLVKNSVCDGLFSNLTRTFKEDQFYYYDKKSKRNYRGLILGNNLLPNMSPEDEVLIFPLTKSDLKKVKNDDVMSLVALVGDKEDKQYVTNKLILKNENFHPVSEEMLKQLKETDSAIRNAGGKTARAE